MRTIEVNLADPDEIARWKAGAAQYVSSLPDWGRYYLYTKPFTIIAGSLVPEHTAYFHDFANILRILNLPPNSRILDVACGPGWLTEFLWRFGYRATGIDACEPLLAIARERVSAGFRPWQRSYDDVRFVRLDIETERLEDQFEAIIFYDCLHHFCDLEGVFRQVDEMLAPGGCLLIKEGAMPPRGSDGEKRLLDEAKRSGTLESPYHHDWLESFLRGRGFAAVRALVEINGFFEKDARTRDQLCALIDAPHSMNIFLCHKEVAGDYGASLSLDLWEQDENGDLQIVVVATNSGSTRWRADPALGPGSVALGIRVRDAGRHTLEEYLGRTPIPRDVLPGESMTISLSYPLSQIARSGPCTLMIDMVAQGAFWFGERGSEIIVRVLTPDQLS
jgi:SAM-dependent methyltransferase